MGKVVVLFVDDEEDFRTLSIRQIRRIVKNIEFEFLEAGNGQQALEMLKGGLKPSVIIVDYAMPKINGMELMKMIDSDNPDLHDVPRIMISGYNQEELVREAQGMRCAFFEKRIDTKVFFQEVCQYMSTKLGFSYP